MNKTIIKNHNELVSNDDTVYHIGDFTMISPWDWSRIEKILDNLNGNHHLILGNHDRQKPFDLVEAGFISVHTSMELIYENRKFILIHDPAASCINRDIPFLCGHIHNLFKIQKNVINVGVDVWDFKPVSIETIIGK